MIFLGGPAVPCIRGNVPRLVLGLGAVEHLAPGDPGREQLRPQWLQRPFDQVVGDRRPRHHHRQQDAVIPAAATALDRVQDFEEIGQPPQGVARGLGGDQEVIRRHHRVHGQHPQRRLAVNEHVLKTRQAFQAALQPLLPEVPGVKQRVRPRQAQPRRGQSQARHRSVGQHLGDHA